MKRFDIGFKKNKYPFSEAPLVFRKVDWEIKVPRRGSKAGSKLAWKKATGRTALYDPFYVAVRLCAPHQDEKMQYDNFQNSILLRKACVNCGIPE